MIYVQLNIQALFPCDQSLLLWGRPGWGLCLVLGLQPIDGQRSRSRWRIRVMRVVSVFGVKNLHNSCILGFFFLPYSVLRTSRYDVQGLGLLNFHGINVLNLGTPHIPPTELGYTHIHHGLWAFKSLKETETVISNTATKTATSESARERNRGTAELCPTSVCVASGGVFSQHISYSCSPI